MEQKRVRSVLRRRFWFRMIVLLTATMGCLGCFLYQAQNTLLWGLIFGLSGSALVWALVELFDFFIQTHHQYCIDRSNFFIMTNEYLSRIKTVIRKDKVHIPWQEVQQIWNELWEQVAHFPFEGGVYFVSKEFSDAANYIETLYWKFTGC